MASISNECRECGFRWSDNGRGDGCERCGDDDPISFYDDEHLDHPDTEDAEEEIQWAS